MRWKVEARHENQEAVTWQGRAYMRVDGAMRVAQDGEIFADPDFVLLVDLGVWTKAEVIVGDIHGGIAEADGACFELMWVDVGD
jgi:hypothetical protein